MDFLNFNSIETLPDYESRAAFTVNSATVFREDVDIMPTIVDDSLSYIPWSGDNLMPFKIIEHIEKDETLATCQMFNGLPAVADGCTYIRLNESDFVEWHASVMNIQEFYADSLGQEFCRAISNALLPTFGRFA